MTDYVESFHVGGHRFGIEKQEDCFQLWSNGCGIGQAATIEVARKRIHDYAISQLNAEYHGHQQRMAEAQRTLQKLGTDPFYLARFATSLSSGERAGSQDSGSAT